MGQPAAKEGDQVTATDTHILMVPAPPAPPVPTPFPMPFVGLLNGKLSDSTFIDNKKAAVEGSEAQNTPPHVPTAGPFQNPPKDKGTIKKGSDTVFIDGKAAARNGDIAETCNDPTDLPIGQVIASGTVIVG